MCSGPTGALRTTKEHRASPESTKDEQGTFRKAKGHWMSLGILINTGGHSETTGSIHNDQSTLSTTRGGWRTPEIILDKKEALSTARGGLPENTQNHRVTLRTDETLRNTERT